MTVVVCNTMQDKYQTVAEALQTAVISLLDDEDMKYKRSFYYWAAFISHGFASVLLDDAFLGEIHTRLEKIRQKSSAEQGGDDELTMEKTIMTLTRDAYHRLEEREQTLSREWCAKWESGVRD